MYPQWSGPLSLLKRFIDNDSGATAIEYGLIISLIVVVMLTGLTAFADQSNGIFNVAMNTLSAALK